MDYGHSGESIKGKRAEREAIAFIDQLVVDVGGLKNHLRKLQQKCEDVDARLRPAEFPKSNVKVERLKVNKEKSVELVRDEKNQERKDKYWSSPKSLKPVSLTRETPDEQQQQQQQKVLTEKKEKTYGEYASNSIKASNRTVRGYHESVKSFKHSKARDRHFNKQDLEALKDYQKGISGSRVESRLLSNAISGWVEQPEGEDIDGQDVIKKL